MRTIKVKFEWEATRDRTSGYWVATCKEIGQSAEGETMLDLRYAIEDVEEDYEDGKSNTSS